MKIVRGLSYCIFMLLLFFIYISNVSGAQKKLTIKGNITNVPPNSSNEIFLYSVYGNEFSEITSALINGQGDFKLELNITLQRVLFKIGFDKMNAATIILSEEEDGITIKADYGQLKEDKIRVINSRENDAHMALLNEGERLKSKWDGLSKEKSRISPFDPLAKTKSKTLDNKISSLIGEYNENIYSIRDKYPETHMAKVLLNLSLIPRLIDHPELQDSYDNERAFMHDFFFEFVDFADELIIYNHFLVNKYFIYLRSYTQHTPEGFMDSVDLILSKTEANSVVRKFTLEFFIDVFSKKGPDVVADYIMDTYVDGCDAPLSERVVEEMENIGWLGIDQIAPDIVSKDPQGEMIALSSLAKKNNVVMVYFWASWCNFCKAESPIIMKLYKKFKDKGLGIYAVAIESDNAEWHRAIKEHQFTWTNVSDLNMWESKAVKAYRVYKIPSIYLLDNKSRILAKNLKGTELKEKLEELLN